MGRLTPMRNHPIMRVAIATLVALLILSFVDKHFNVARCTRAATTLFSANCEIVRLGSIIDRYENAE
jgi:hypothetical protein